MGAEAEMDRSGSSKKILEAEAEVEAMINSPLPHHWLVLELYVPLGAALLNPGRFKLII